MNKLRFRRLEKYKVGGTGDRIELAIPAPKSATGKVLRSCPISQCEPGQFQLGSAPDQREIADRHSAVIRRRPGTPGTTCPYCGTDAEDSDFTSEADRSAAKEIVKRAVFADLADAFSKTLEDSCRGSKYLTYKKSSRPKALEPRFARPDLLREITCDICSRNYGVYASALFCPDCGAGNLHLHFARELVLVRDQIEQAKTAETGGQKEKAFRLTGNALEDILTALETFQKLIYRFLVKKRFPQQEEEYCSSKAIGNHFQNVERTRELYTKLNFDPFADLNEDEMRFFRINIQKRHILGHNLGIVDEKYANSVGTKSLGQTVVLLACETERFGDLCARIVTRLQREFREFRGPHV